MNKFLNIIVFVENMKIHNFKEIYNLIHVVKYAREKEGLIVLILAHKSVIVENVNLVILKEQ